MHILQQQRKFNETAVRIASPPHTTSIFINCTFNALGYFFRLVNSYVAIAWLHFIFSYITRLCSHTPESEGEYTAYDVWIKLF